MNFFATDMKPTNDIKLETPGSHNQEEENDDSSCYYDACSKVPEDIDSKDFLEKFYNISCELSDKLLQNNKKEEININKTVNNNNNEQEKINEKTEKLLNNENMQQDDNNISEQKRNENIGQEVNLNALFNNEEEIKENNNPKYIGKEQISDQEGCELYVNEKYNNTNNQQMTSEVKYNNINKAEGKEENMNQNEEYMGVRTRNIEAEIEKTAIEGLDSPKIQFIQIPKKKVLNNSKIGVQKKVCCC